ncbi:RTC4-like domain-containing protein [Fusarium flagelliforme]|uniref:Restriction of telomere capping protein 4 n=1 Tax=Fusarium flagelliforme TaxID=2675880 RepID=A0A395MV90_9HYPO|nr:RTC4-like domain-containing protein [Fusarium flagelliforme]KAH7197516.1 RTC4-like domain-containing protein [Fusarium flagelliforme]RFN51660.1 rtc4-like domain-containing protein [Fusarium flagelliforme]
MSRVLGLSRNQKPKTLLSTFSGNKRKLEKEVEEDAPPLSSEDEDEEPPSVADLKLKPSGPKETLPDSDDSEAERPARGDIKRSNFSTSSTSKSRKSTSRKKGKSGSKPLTAGSTDRESSPSSKKRKTTSLSENAKPNQFVDERGFTKSRYDKFGGFKYGKAAQASRSSQVSRSSQGSETKQGDRTRSDGKTMNKRHKDDDLLNSSPIEAEPVFKSVARELLSPEDSEPKKGMLAVPADDFGSPEKAVKTKMVFPGSTSTPQNPRSSRLGVMKVSKVYEEEQRKKKARQEERPPIPEYKPATFVNPVALDSSFDLESGNTNILSSPIISDLDQLSDTESDNMPPEDEENLQDKMTQCPWCGDAVSEQSLKDYSKGKRLNVQMQTRFCAKHKKETAMDTWRERGYPHIDWERLEERLKDHQHYLSKIVDGKTSHYRNVLAEKIRTGQARSLKKEGDLNPGYYGPRGCKLMCDYLVEEFGESLKEKATQDRVIAGRGSAAFIQVVLVAELAVQLIMEDMNVSVGDAREIMEESKTLGELLHEEV